MFFRKKPKPPLEDAIDLVEQAVKIAYAYKRDKKFHPSENDLKLFERFSDLIWRRQATARYISRCMGQRFRGEPEGIRKFTNPDIFDYHYPP